MFSLTNKKGVDPYDYTNAFDHFFQNKINFSFPQKAWLQLDHLTLEKSCHFFFGGGIGIFNSRVGRRAKTRSWNWLFQLGFGSGTICRKAGTLLLSSQCPVHWFRGFAAWNWGFWILNMFHHVPRVHCWNLNQSWNMFEKNIWFGKLKLTKSQNLPFQIAKKHPAFHSKKL